MTKRIGREFRSARSCLPGRSSPTGMPTYKMPIKVTCWALLLLTLLPVLAISARNLPAPPPASFTRSESSRDVPASLRPGFNTHFQGSQRRSLRPGPEETIYGHRLLVGSSPPTCQGKCGSCNPCNPIHVSIGSPHGAITQQEYYPEVWRCKCGNKLFMP